MSSRKKTGFGVLLLISQLLCGSLLQAQTTPSSVKSPEEKRSITTVDPNAKAPDYSQEAFVIQDMKTIYRYEKDGTGKREMVLKVKIQSEAGVKGFGQLIFPYSSTNEKLDIQYVRVVKADSSVISASETNVQDLSSPIAIEAPVYTDLRQKHITVPGLRPGDTLEYHLVSQVHTPFAPNHFWLDHNFVSRELIVLGETLEVNVPADSKIKLKTEPGVDPIKKEHDGRLVYSWKRANLERVEPDKDEEKKESDDQQEEAAKRPDVQMTTFQSWDEVGQWYAELQRGRSTPDDKIRIKTEELIKGLTTDTQKVEALYQFVARNFRYVSLSLGQGRYQPHAATDVFVNQYGDCKDKHTLLSAMLSAAGLRAYPALMNSTRKVDVDIPSPGQFDHVISAIPVGAEMLWADTTAEVAPFRLLAPPLRDKQSLLIPSSGPARLETTPADPPFLFSEVSLMEGQVNDLGKLSGHTRIVVRGDSELLFRLMFRRTPQSEWKHIGSYISMGGGLPRAEVTGLKISDPAEMEKPFEVDYDFSSDDFLDWSGKKIKVNLPFPSLNLTNAAANKQTGTKPIELGVPTQISYRLKLTLPQKYAARAPLPVKLHRDYADYSSSYRLEGNTLIAERNLHLRQRQLPAARTQDYNAFLAAARADEAQMLSLETTDASAPAIPDSVKVEDLITAAEAAAKNENYGLVEELLKRAIEKEPKHLTARRQLGWALFLQLKFEPAAEVLREQTRINPFDDYAHNVLGQVYWQQQKFAEAEQAFRKQIEVTPLDKSAHSNLARLLVERRKYKEAVPELEQAIALDPEEEYLYVSLGRAYLNLGQTDKADEAFDKATKLAPEAGVWNDVAYNLALSNVQLDKAQQYAESAVTEIATELRNVELSGLTTQSVQGVNRLVAYWDTLGWVHFQRGNLDLAEKYINAAWTVGQYGEVGYHLGQIIEKRGKKEEAIRIYSMAAAGFSSVPETIESLDRLVGKTKREELVKQAYSDIQHARTIKFGVPGVDLKGTKEAQIFVVLTPGAGRKAQVAETKFIRGDEKLKPAMAALKSADFNLVFPDDAATKVIRRGTLFCQNAGGGCSFIMVTTVSTIVD
jgi:tetratricopeptide (TPR) repeat protein